MYIEKVNRDNIFTVYPIKTNKKSSKNLRNEDVERKLVSLKNIYDSFENEEVDIHKALKSRQNVQQINIRKIKHFIDISSLMFIFLSSIISPLHLCFDSDYSLWTLKFFIDCYFLLEILITFYTPFIDENENIISDFFKVAYHYFTHWFFFDTITTIPTFIFDLLDSHLKILQWVVVFRMFKVLKYNFLIHIQLSQDTKLDNVIKLILMFILGIHVSSCYWIFLGNLKSFSRTWLILIKEDSYLDLYIASIYYHLVTITTIGYGDVFPQNMIERIYTCFLLFIGVMLFSFTVSSLSKFLVDDNKKLWELENKLKKLKEIRADYHISDSLYLEIKHDLKNEFLKNQSDRVAFIEDLPSNVRHQLVGHIYEVIIKDVLFFKDQPFNFILYVLPFLKFYKFHKDQKLLSIGESIEEMYIVINGCLSLTLGTQYSDIEIGVVRENQHFGDIFLQTNQKATFDLKVKSRSADIFILKKEHFHNIKSVFNLNMINVVSESFNKFETLSKRSIQYISLYNYEKSVENLRKIIKLLNMNLMETGFDDYYNNDIELEDINDFLDNHNFEYVKEYLGLIIKNKKDKLNRLNKRIGCSVSENISNNICYDAKDIRRKNRCKKFNNVLRKGKKMQKKIIQRFKEKINLGEELSVIKKEETLNKKILNCISFQKLQDEIEQKPTKNKPSLTNNTINNKANRNSLVNSRFPPPKYVTKSLNSRSKNPRNSMKCSIKTSSTNELTVQLNSSFQIPSSVKSFENSKESSQLRFRNLHISLSCQIEILKNKKKAIDTSNFPEKTNAKRFVKVSEKNVSEFNNVTIQNTNNNLNIHIDMLNVIGNIFDRKEMRPSKTKSNLFKTCEDNNGVVEILVNNLKLKNLYTSIKLFFKDKN